jgi:hypothetical protein
MSNFTKMKKSRFEIQAEKQFDMNYPAKDVWVLGGFLSSVTYRVVFVLHVGEDGTDVEMLLLGNNNLE